MKGKILKVRYTLPIQFSLSTNEKKETTTAQAVNGDVFDTVDVPPAFPGGEVAMFKWLGQNISYPVDAQDKRIQGGVVTQFVVRADGSISDVAIIRGVAPSLDEEAIRVIKSMPTWTPGEHTGKKVSVRYTLPVQFKLDGDDAKKTDTELAGNPLVIVDGKEFDRSALDEINPADIESVSVFKDKAATEQYGEKGADGVIVIKTKKNKK